MSKLLYQGHGSYRITANDGRIIYVDPYAGKGYEKTADLILVTHQHSDHNQTSLCAKKPSCKVITNEKAIANGKHLSFDVDGIGVQAVIAANKNHDPKKCVGYIISFDGLKLYASGDTSKTEQMESFAEMKLDYAIFPGDGIFNMGLKEAAECAKIVGAKHNIIVHLKPGGLFDRKKAEKWEADNKLIIDAGEEIEL